jgi:hypothetical protein
LDDQKDAGRTVSRAEQEARAMAKRDEIFKAICAELLITPAKLARLPRVELVDLVRRRPECKRVDETLVVQWAADFARRAETNPCP